MKPIYKQYKQRLIEISGKNRSLYLRRISKRSSYDIGQILEGHEEEIATFLDFLWKGRRIGYTLIDSSAKERIAKNLKVEDKIKPHFKDTAAMSPAEKKTESAKRDKLRREEVKKAYLSQVTEIKNVKKEIEDFARETGRYEMYIGYPFVEGSAGRDLNIKAPLFLFPVTVNVPDENTVELELKNNEAIQFNKVLLLAYANANRLKIDDIETEFDSLPDKGFNTVDNVLESLAGFSIYIKNREKKGKFAVRAFDEASEPKFGDDLEIKNYCVLGRFPLANAIYNDYVELEKNGLGNEAINELLDQKKSKPVKRPDGRLYTVNSLDYAQESAIEHLNYSGNMVIYGPPGTGKSQTIVNIITDAIAKEKTVLVVSQKKAALDVVFNRLGSLNNKAMFIVDPEKEKTVFYERVRNAHEFVTSHADTNDYSEEYRRTEGYIQAEIDNLNTVNETLFTKTDFGLSLQQMYANSHQIGEDSADYRLYKSLLKDKALMSLEYKDFYESLRLIADKKKDDFFYKFKEWEKKNTIIEHVKTDIDVHTVNQAKSYVKRLLTENLVPFNTAKYPHSRQLSSFFFDNDLDIRGDKQLKPLVRMISSVKNPKLYRTLNISKILFPAYPFVKRKVVETERELKEDLEVALNALRKHISDYSMLERILDEEGYSMAMDSIIGGNSLFINLINEALERYVEIRDINIILKSLSSEEKSILRFAYRNSTDKKSFKEVISKILELRIYHALVSFEDEQKVNLSKMMDFESSKNRLMAMKEEQRVISKNIVGTKFVKDYLDFCKAHEDDPKLSYKIYRHNINKTEKYWSIRKMMDVYGEFLLKLFPCWLLSPDSVSQILPLAQGLFDIVLFDEASQVFIEYTIPTIYRGKYIVVAGDTKQLKPSDTFMKRYYGNEDESLDYSMQAALESKSLLDLAQSKYKDTNLTYHYRSRSEELINFSNYAFYERKLQISPNITKNNGQKPIERIMVNGKWINRKNTEEAAAIVKLLKEIFRTRKNKETIGIISFNTEQGDTIENAIEAETRRDAWFRSQILHETQRNENGEDVSMFVKNLENVQGDERDIIIFSIGYAQNETGKVSAQFGPLSVEGGENRLNVAVTRAKSKIYVVTSIEPEELHVEGSKNLGPKIFKAYLKYVRAVSNGDNEEVRYILESFTPQAPAEFGLLNGHVEAELAAELRARGYDVETNLGNTEYKISVAIYDKKLDRYILGMECDYAAYRSSKSMLERDVYRPKFLESRGWKIFRVWSRDWWHNKSEVIQQITKLADRLRQEYREEADYQKKLTAQAARAAAKEAAEKAAAKERLAAEKAQAKALPGADTPKATKSAVKTVAAPVKKVTTSTAKTDKTAVNTKKTTTNTEKKSNK